MKEIDLRKTYNLKEILGSGSFGDVYLCIHKETKSKFALKIQKTSSKNSLKHEINIYKYLNSNNLSKTYKEKRLKLFLEFEKFSQKGEINKTKLRDFRKQSSNYIAKIYASGFCMIDDKEKEIKEEKKSSKKYGFVMDLFEQSVSDFIKMHKLPYKNKNADEENPPIEYRHMLILAVLMIDAIESLHKKFIIHCDIKPANFVFQSGELVLIDFGLAQLPDFNFYEESSSSYTSELNSDDSNNNLKEKAKKKKSFKGTLKYASLNAHNGKVLSFRDDLESLVYLLCSLMEKLPWSKQKRENVPEIKSDYTPECEILRKLLIYTKKLKLNEIIDYSLIKQTFLTELRKNDLEFDLDIFF